MSKKISILFKAMKEPEVFSKEVASSLPVEFKTVSLAKKMYEILDILSRLSRCLEI